MLLAVLEGKPGQGHLDARRVNTMILLLLIFGIVLLCALTIVPAIATSSHRGH
jgi:hypothetical protein